MDFFPDRVLDSSLHTAILTGLLVMWIAAETLGWGVAGFVVAGYFAALAIVHPMSLAATLMECILTYGVVWLLGRGAFLWGLRTPVFGRERFFLFLLVSVPVRLIVEGLAAAELQALFSPLLSTSGWVEGQFFSIGIVLVPLAANALWRPGLARGLVRLGIVTLVTYLLLVYVLTGLLNLHFGRFEVTFENLALDFLATPKVYVVLLTTAFIASRNNKRYGWDYHGILVPSLLALTVFMPAKLLASVVECVVLVGTFRALRKLPFIDALNLEGPRQLAAIYMLAYALKLVVANFSWRYFPSLYVSDIFGFGYLLTSLMAAKCIEKRDTPRVLVPIVVTAVQGFVIGSVLSLGLGAAMPSWPKPTAPLREQARLAQQSLEQSVLRGLSAVRRGSHDSFFDSTSTAIGDRIRISKPLSRLAAVAESRPGELDLADLIGRLREEGLRVEWVSRADGTKCLQAREARPALDGVAGIPPWWWCQRDGPALLVPQPLGDPDSMWAAAYLAHHGEFSLVVLSGLDVNGQDSAAEHRAWIRHLRAIRSALGRRPVWVLRTTRTGPHRIVPRSGAGGAFESLSQVLPDLRVSFQADHGALADVWQHLSPDDSILVVSVERLEASLEASGALDPPEEITWSRFLEEDDAQRSRPQRGDAATWTVGDDLVYIEQVLGLALRRGAASEARLPPALRYVASMTGTRLRRIREEDGPGAWLFENPRSRCHGTWMVRPQGDGWVVAVPDAAATEGLAWYGQRAGELLGAAAVWLGSRQAVDAVAAATEPVSIPHLAVRQALMAGVSTSHPTQLRKLLVIRAQPATLLPVDSVVLSRGTETILAPQQAAMQTDLAPLLALLPPAGFHDGRLTVSFAGAADESIRYLDALTDDHGVTLWLAREITAQAATTPSRSASMQWYQDHGVRVVSEQQLGGLLRGAGLGTPLDRRPTLALMRSHVTTGAAAPLRELKQRHRSSLAVSHTETRLSLVVWGTDWLCRAGFATGAPTDTDPLSGCWSLRP